MKVYNKPEILILIYELNIDINDLSNAGTIGPVGSNNGGDSTSWNDE